MREEDNVKGNNGRNKKIFIQYRTFVMAENNRKCREKN